MLRARIKSEAKTAPREGRKKPIPAGQQPELPATRKVFMRHRGGGTTRHAPATRTELGTGQKPNPIRAASEDEFGIIVTCTPICAACRLILLNVKERLTSFKRASKRPRREVAIRFRLIPTDLHEASNSSAERPRRIKIARIFLKQFDSNNVRSTVENSFDLWPFSLSTCPWAPTIKRLEKICAL